MTHHISNFRVGKVLEIFATEKFVRTRYTHAQIYEFIDSSIRGNVLLNENAKKTLYVQYLQAGMHFPN